MNKHRKAPYEQRWRIISVCIGEYTALNHKSPCNRPRTSFQASPRFQGVERPQVKCGAAIGIVVKSVTF